MIVSLFVTTVALAAQPTRRPSDAERGEELYRRHCLACHGAANDGQGPIAASLVQPVPSLIGKIDPKKQAEVVLKGRGGMPGYQAAFGHDDAVRVLKTMQKLTLEEPITALAGAGPPVRAQRPRPAPEPETPAADEGGAEAEDTDP